MKSYLLPVSMCLFGLFLGLLLPYAAERFSVYKLKKKGVEPVWKAKFIPLIMKMFVLLLNTVLCLLSGLLANSIYQALSLAVLFSLAVLISLIDVRTRLVPNELVLLMLFAGALFQLSYNGYAFLITSIFTTAGMMFLFSITAGFVGFGKVGAGDIKLAGAMGFVLGYPGILNALAAMSAGLLIYGLAGLAAKKLTLKSSFPFAPFMMFGMTFALLRILFKI